VHGQARAQLSQSCLYTHQVAKCATQDARAACAQKWPDFACKEPRCRVACKEPPIVGEAVVGERAGRGGKITSTSCALSSSAPAVARV
jgi:hypothetical protein